MTSVAESIPASTTIGATLQQGVNSLDNQQSVVFTQYARVALPLDGFVFFVRVGLLASNALTFALGTDGRPISAENLPGEKTLTVAGSMHYATQQNQDESESMAINRMVFTSLTEIQDFNLVNDGLIYIGEFDDGVRFAFSRRKSFYQQAELWHYEGDAIYSIMESQIIDEIDDLLPTQQVVSNSLPIWLALQNGAGWPQPFNPQIPIFPSYAVPDNWPPPYAACHIVPETTEAMQSAPYIDPDNVHWLLTKEEVRFTIYGERNTNALAFQDFLLQASVDQPNLFGVMNMTVIRDDKRTQSELGILAMKKTFTVQASYYQSGAYRMALKYINKVIPTFYVDGMVSA